MDLSACVDPKVPDCKYGDFYTLGGYAYTEDHFMVYKLYVYDIPRMIIVREVREYFSKYGNVKNVRFVAHKYPHPYKIAFVHFESPSAAAKVLYFYRATCVGRTKQLGLVKVCYSWHQPNCQTTKEIFRDWCNSPEICDQEDQFVAPNRDSIHVLNDDCLEVIIRKLPITSQLHFARSCSRVCQIFQMSCKTQYRTLFLDRLVNLTKWQVRDFFDFAGDYMKRIEGTLQQNNPLRILKYISIYCHNVEEMDLKSSMLWCCRNVTFLNIFRKLDKLKILKFSDRFILSDSFLSNLSPTIESLTAHCILIKNEHFISLCTSLRNLKELNLGERFYINVAMVNAMVDLCQNLETLTVCINRLDYGLVAKLPKLKNLTVFLSRKMGCCPSLYTQLIEHKSHLLEFLRIDGNDCVNDNVAQQISCLKALRTLHCQNNSKLTDNGVRYFCGLQHLEEINLSYSTITNAAVLNLVLNCKKLKRVYIQNCYSISDRLIYRLIQEMQKQMQNTTYKQRAPILLLARSSNIQKDILNKPEYKASSDLVVVDLVDYTSYNSFCNSIRN